MLVPRCCTQQQQPVMAAVTAPLREVRRCCWTLLAAAAEHLPEALLRTSARGTRRALALLRAETAMQAAAATTRARTSCTPPFDTCSKRGIAIAMQIGGRGSLMAGVMRGSAAAAMAAMAAVEEHHHVNLDPRMVWRVVCHAHRPQQRRYHRNVPREAGTQGWLQGEGGETELALTSQQSRSVHPITTDGVNQRQLQHSPGSSTAAVLRAPKMVVLRLRPRKARCT